MKKRIFIAIRISPNMEKSAELWQNKHSDFNVRWIKPKNLHITLIPPWYVDENQLIDVIKQTKLSLNGKEPFVIEFNRVLFGPPGRTPRLIWAEVNSSKEFSDLKKDLEESLFKSTNSGFYKKEQRQPKLHLTIARFKPHEIDKTKPLLDEVVNWKMIVDSVQIMESELKRGGAEYTVLESVSLQ